MSTLTIKQFDPGRPDLSVEREKNSESSSLAPGGVAELGYDTGKSTRGDTKMISWILMGNWNISKF